MLKITPITTGSIQIKNLFIRGRGRGMMRKLNVFRDRQFTPPLPVHAYLIEHPEGNILIDAGESARAMGRAYYTRFMNWVYMSCNARFHLSPDQEIAPMLKELGLSPGDIHRIVFTHLHQDHVGGMASFPSTEMVVSAKEYTSAYLKLGFMHGYMPANLHWSDRVTRICYNPVPLGPFPESYPLTAAGDVILVPTEGHTPGHMSVVVKREGLYYFFAGDSAYTLENMLDLHVDGICFNLKQATETLVRTREFCREFPTVYLPAHDIEGCRRLVEGITVF